MNPACQNPLCLAIVLADSIHRDPGSNKHTILGTYSAIFAAELPITQPITLYIALTDGRGKTPFEVRIVAMDDEFTPIQRITGVVEFPDPRMVAELVLQFGVELKHSGEYRIQLHTNDEFLVERRLIVIGDQDEQEGE